MLRRSSTRHSSTCSKWCWLTTRSSPAASAAARTAELKGRAAALVDHRDKRASAAAAMDA
eukprot:271857-Prymnesium_polylepis.1